MAQVVMGDYLKMTIPELKNIRRQHRWVKKLAINKGIPDNNAFYADILKEEPKVLAAIEVLKIESRLHELKLDYADALDKYTRLTTKD